MAYDITATDAYVSSRREWNKVEMLFAHLRRILRPDRLQLHGPNGDRDEFHLAATVQNLTKLAKLLPNRPQDRTGQDRTGQDSVRAKAFAGKSHPFIARQ